ncbi:MAG: hypothetical protein GX801_06480, partial [Fibrobacter sp.]|nr:hypothetical protein [Fibrobacter sp.]
MNLSPKIFAFEVDDFEIKSSNPLTVTANSRLKFNLKIPLVKSSGTTANDVSDTRLSKLIDPGIAGWEGVLGTHTIMAEGEVAYGQGLTGSLTFNDQSIDLNQTQTLSSLVGKIATELAVSSVIDTANGVYALYGADKITISNTSDLTNFRAAGLYNGSSQAGYVVDVKIHNDEDNVKSDDTLHRVELNVKHNNENKTITTYFIGGMSELTSALNAALMANGINDSLAVAMGDKLLLTKGNSSFSALTIFEDAKSKAELLKKSLNEVQIYFSERVAPPRAGDGVKIKVTISDNVEGNQSPNPTSVTFSNIAGLNGAASLYDVAQILQKTFDNNTTTKSKIKVEVREGRLLLRTTDFAKKLTLSYEGDPGKAYLQSLGFDLETSTAIYSSGVSIKYQLQNGGEKGIDLTTFFAGKEIGNIELDVICHAIANNSGGDLSYIDGQFIANSGNINSIFNTNSGSLASLLGIAGHAYEEQDFTVKINALRTSAAEMSDFKLDTTYTLSGTPQVYLRYGILDTTLPTTAIGFSKNVSYKLSTGDLPSVEDTVAPFRLTKFIGVFYEMGRSLPSSLGERLRYAVEEKLSEEKLAQLIAEIKSFEENFGEVFDGYIEDLDKMFGAFASFAEENTNSALSTAVTTLASAIENVKDNYLIFIAETKECKESITGGMPLSYATLQTSFNILKDEFYSALSEAQSDIKSHLKTFVPDNFNIPIEFDAFGTGIKLGTISVDENGLSIDTQASGIGGLSLFAFNDSFSMNAVVGSIYEFFKEKLLKSLCDAEKGLLAEEVPILGKSISDIMGLDQKINDLIVSLNQNYPRTLQDLQVRFEKFLGVTLGFEIIDGCLIMGFTLEHNINSQKYSFDSLGGKDSFVGGAFEAYLDGAIKLNFQLKIDSQGEISLIIPAGETDKFISGNIKLFSDKLSSDLNISVGKETFPLLQVVNMGERKSSLELELSFDIDSGSIQAGKLELDELQTTLFAFSEMHINMGGIDVGFIRLGKLQQIAEGKNNIISEKNSPGAKFDEVPEIGILLPKIEALQSVDIDAPNNGDLVLDLSNLKSIDLTNLSLFEQLRLVVDGLSETLRRAQSGMTSDFINNSLRNIPLVGDSIVGTADFLTQFDKKLVEPLRKFVNYTPNLDTMVVNRRLVELLQGYIPLPNVDENDNSSDCPLSDCSETSVTWSGKTFDMYYEGIQYFESKNGDEIGWRIRLQGNYDLAADANFDLGAPGLGLKAEGGVGLDLGWIFDFGFGISKNEGAYILLSNGDKIDSDWLGKGNSQLEGYDENNTDPDKRGSGDDILLTLRAFVDEGTKIYGSLGFLQMEATVKEVNGTVKDSPTKSPNSGQQDVFKAYLGVDLNDGVNNKEHFFQEDLESDREKFSQISVSSLASALSPEVHLQG